MSDAPPPIREPSRDAPPTPRDRLAYLRAVLALRSVKVAVGVSLVVAIGCAFSSLTAVLGVESALVHGIVLPPFVAAMGARIAIHDRNEPTTRLGRDAVIALGLVMAPPLVFSLVATLFVRWCSPLEGAAFFALGAGAGIPLALLLGLALGTHVRGPRTATTIAALVPVLLVLVGLWRFYATPAIYSYAHFAGYFPGTLYDPDIEISREYLTFRTFSLVWASALAAAAFGLRDGGRKRPVLATFVSVLVMIGLVGEAYGPELGHRSTAASIREALGGVLEGERCDVVFPRELPRERAERIRDDCDFRVREAEEVLGVTHPARITAFFFRDEDEKRRLMGASGTYVAKPWRDEVYLQLSAWPHPVLFHEIVHVVASATGIGPFRVAGTLGGIVPSPGIIEGTAVAVAWDETEGMTPHEWAAALSRLGHTPSIAGTEGLAFLLQPASRAYTANGSFIRWILETEGEAAVLRLYRTGSYAEALGRPLAEAEAEWHAFLETLPLPPEAEGLARLRFERPAIWSAVCPHALATLEERAAAEVAAGDDEAAVATCDAMLEIDPGHASVRAWRVGALGRSGRFDDARAALADLSEVATTPVIAHARGGLADALWRAGREDEALALYRESFASPGTDDSLRQLEVEILALETGGAMASTLGEVFVPSPRRTTDGATVVSAIARLRESRSDGLADYLEGRQLAARERFDLAEPLLVRCRDAGLPTDRVRREARRMLATVLVANGAFDAAERLLWEILADPTSTEGQRVDANDWLARIRSSR